MRRAHPGGIRPPPSRRPRGNDGGYDSKADISVYRLGDGDVTPVARYSDVEITNWEEVCWGEGNALYVRGSYYNDEEDGPLTKEPSINA